jgi:FXSXX-COOH protein
MSWEPLLDVTDESMVSLVESSDTVLSRVIHQIVAGLGAGPDGVISAFQSIVDSTNVMVSGFNSAIVP